METKTSRTKEIVISIIALLLFAGIYYYVLNNFNRENDTKVNLVKDTNKEDKDYILVEVQVVSVDPVKGDVVTRLNFTPFGSYTDDGHTINQEITFYINSISGKNEHVFSKGKRMTPVDATLEMYGGVVTDYPFDTHDADIEMLMVSKEKNDSGKTTETNVSVIKEISFKASVHGFDIEESKDPGEASDYTEVSIHIERTKSVVYFSVFVMVLMWAILISVVLILLSVLVRNRKMEYSMFGFFASMLFALPALRSLQPFVPGIGCYSDYISFFWAEGAIAACLIIMIFTWLKRPGAKQT